MTITAFLLLSVNVVGWLSLLFAPQEPRRALVADRDGFIPTTREWMEVGKR